MENQPEIRLGNGSLYKASGAWDDLQAAIENAQHLIYITGHCIIYPIQSGFCESCQLI